MALNLKNPEAERLLAEVAQMSGESLTGAVITALRERKLVLLRKKASEQKLQDIYDFLQQEVWAMPTVGAHKSEEDILGYGDGWA